MITISGVGDTISLPIGCYDVEVSGVGNVVAIVAGTHVPMLIMSGVSCTVSVATAATLQAVDFTGTNNTVRISVNHPTPTVSVSGVGCSREMMNPTGSCRR